MDLLEANIDYLEISLSRFLKGSVCVCVGGGIMRPLKLKSGLKPRAREVSSLELPLVLIVAVSLLWEGSAQSKAVLSSGFQQRRWACSQ